MNQVDIKRLLAILLNSADMDAYTQAKDCLDAFEDYNWKPKEGADKNRFELFLDRGKEKTLSMHYLDEFMELVDGQGEVHPYYAVYMGNKCLSDQ